MSSIRRHSLWVMNFALIVLAVLILEDNSRAFFENARYRTFSKQEIQTMEQTTATIQTKFGEIILKFFPEVAPNHVNSFIELARDGFYDDTTFHRIVPGFVIQGGDPNTKSDDRSRHGMGGPGFTLKAEFSKLPHKRGSVSMARAANPDSAGSQFFICVADAPFLDGEYTIFGEVVEGMDVVDKIVSQPKDQRDNPIERVEMKVRVVGPKEKP
jgi:peptidyl-prolyl cis-trans isomerase B (cyclophilin B)